MGFFFFKEDICKLCITVLRLAAKHHRWIDFCSELPAASNQVIKMD